MKVITGNPGTGKHTIAKKVAKSLDLELVDINELAILEGTVRKRDRVLDVDVAKLKRVLTRTISKDSLLVGHLAPYVISKKIADLVVVLRRSPYDLESVYQKRRYQREKMIENIGSEILGITYYDSIKSFGIAKTVQFDTTKKSISETTRKVESFFLGKKTRGDMVDWLAVVSKRGDLERFFSY